MAFVARKKDDGNLTLVGFSKHHDVTPIHIDSIEEPGQ